MTPRLTNGANARDFQRRMAHDLYSQIRPQLDPHVPPRSEADAVELARALAETGPAAVAELAVHLPIAREEGDRLACAGGCSACCHQHVAVTVPELLWVFEALHQHLNPEALVAFRDHVAHTAAKIQGTTRFRRQQLRVACALLDETGRCRVYLARPLLCRGLTSFDARACSLDNWGTVPMYLPPLLVYETLQETLVSALRAAGLDGARIELTLGLHLLFEVPARAQLWLRGEAPFSSAQMTFDFLGRAGAR